MFQPIYFLSFLYYFQLFSFTFLLLSQSLDLQKKEKPEKGLLFSILFSSSFLSSSSFFKKKKKIFLYIKLNMWMLTFGRNLDQFFIFCQVKTFNSRKKCCLVSVIWEMEFSLWSYRTAFLQVMIRESWIFCDLLFSSNFYVS